MPKVKRAQQTNWLSKETYKITSKPSPLQFTFACYASERTNVDPQEPSAGISLSGTPASLVTVWLILSLSILSLPVANVARRQEVPSWQ